MLGSGNNLSRGAGVSSDVPPLPQCLQLEPIKLGNQKYTRSGELRRVLGVPSRTSSEDNSFGIAHPKPSPPVATEELKNFKESVQDTSREAGDRAKKLGESIFKLDKYAEALGSKKRRRNDMSPGERMEGVNPDKARSQIPRTQDNMAQRSDERKKMFGLNKRARTSVADVRGDGRVSAVSRQQATEREFNSLPGISGETTRIEEKIRRLPVGGEGWETKMKRKRSVATLGNRVINNDQRSMQPKLTADSKLRSCDTQNFRSKSSAGVSGTNRSDASFEPHSPDIGTLPRTQLEPVSFARDRFALAEQRLMAKGNKRNLQVDNVANNSSAMLKRKVSRTPRTGGPIVVGEPSTRAEPPSPALQGSSAHAMAQWVGQRPHKNSRTRRTNVVSPVTKNAEGKFAAQGFATPDFSPRASPATTGSPSVVDNSTSKIKRELKNASSPFGLSESEDSGIVDHRSREHGLLESGEVTTNVKAGSLLVPVRKNKMYSGHNGDGSWKQKKSGNGSSLTTPACHSIMGVEKSTQNAKPASDKNKRSGRPPTKKLKDRKASTRLGSNVNTVSPDVAGESEDDREDLLAAANSARQAANLSCSGKFWKSMEYIFASISSDDMQFIKDQLGFVEELDDSLREATANAYNIMGSVDFSNQAASTPEPSFERLDMRKLNDSAPLYKRVLSALIEEDDGEEVVQFGEGKNLSLHYASDDSHCGSCTHIDNETRERDRMESEVESNADFQILKSCLFDRMSSDRSAVSNTVSVITNEQQWLRDEDLCHSDIGLGSEICSINFPSSDAQYQLMSLDERLLLELQSIGIFPDALPDLAEETISTEVLELKEGVRRQIENKKKSLEKLKMRIQKGKDSERSRMEHLAMDQLVELAHKKRLASRGNKASKVRKVSRQTALSFVKRTMARCKRFEETGRSCFTDPTLQDILFSSPVTTDAKSSDNGGGGSGTASNTLNEPANHQTEAKGSGAVSSTKRREAMGDEGMGCASSKITTPSAVDSNGGNRFKRSCGGGRDVKLNKDNDQTKPKHTAANTRTTHPTGPSTRISNCLPPPEEGEDPALDLSNLTFPELDSIDQPADLGNWFDGLQDSDTMGLEIPMDDLSDVKLLL